MGYSMGPHWLEEDWNQPLGWPPDNLIVGCVAQDYCGTTVFLSANPDYRADLSNLQGQVYDDTSELDAAIRQRIVAVEPETTGETI